MKKRRDVVFESLSKLVSFAALVLATGIILLIGYSLYSTADGFSNQIHDFCGWSTNGECIYDSDCIVGGCSNQICQPKDEPSLITTCEWKDCYNASRYGLSCKCIDGKCQWS